jgi:hypothetical protein
MKPDTYRRLGELLVERAIISERQLQVALTEQRAGKRRLGDVLVERGYADEMAIAKCLADQYSHPLVDLGTLTIDPSVAAALSPENAVTLRALPFARTEDGLAVAISDPVDPATTDQLYSLLKTRLELHVAPIGALGRQIRFAYGLSDEAPGLTAPEASKAPRRFANVQLRLRSEYGALFDAYDALLDRRVSLFCRPTGSSNSETTEIARAAAATCDPAIAAIHDLMEEKEFTWTVMEPLPVDNLGRILKVRGPRQVPEAAEIVATVAEAVDAMGRSGRNHTWACPDNIFLGAHGAILAPMSPAPPAYRMRDGASEPTARDAVHALGTLLEACLLKPYSTDEEELPFQMREILFRALGTDESDAFEAPIEIADELRSYNWVSITKHRANTTREEREQLLHAMEGTLEHQPKLTFWDWLFGRSAA